MVISMSILLTSQWHTWFSTSAQITIKSLASSNIFKYVVQRPVICWMGCTWLDAHWSPYKFITNGTPQLLGWRCFDTAYSSVFLVGFLAPKIKRSRANRHIDYICMYISIYDYIVSGRLEALSGNAFWSGSWMNVKCKLCAYHQGKMNYTKKSKEDFHEDCQLGWSSFGYALLKKMTN